MPEVCSAFVRRASLQGRTAGSGSGVLLGLFSHLAPQSGVLLEALARFRVARPGGLLELALRGDDTTAATVLSAAIRAGVKLSSFAPAASDLEELFLQITNAPEVSS